MTAAASQISGRVSRSLSKVLREISSFLYYKKINSKQMKCLSSFWYAFDLLLLVVPFVVSVYFV